VPDVPPPEPGLEDEYRRDPKADQELRNAARLDALEDQHHAIKLLVIKHWGKILLAFMYGLAAGFGIALLIVFWHYIMPSNVPACETKTGWIWNAPWCPQWLSEAQVHKLQSILFSGGVGAFLVGIGQRYFTVSPPSNQ